MAATPQVAIDEPRFFREATVTALPQRSRIFDIPVDLGQPAELIRRITGWVGSGSVCAISCSQI